jgi:hypothetical protein
MTAPPDRASEAARLLASLVSDRAAFPDEAAEDLKRLLGDRLADPPWESCRWDHLALVVTLLFERAGHPPTTREYESARADREADAPSASALAKRYGEWIAVLRAATRLIRPNTSKPARVERSHYRRPYRPVECAIAIARFYRRFGTWPTYSEYNDWAKLSRSAARACGAPDPNLPAGPTVVRHYGTFDRAVEAAKAFYRGRS